MLSIDQEAPARQKAAALRQNQCAAKNDPGLLDCSDSPFRNQFVNRPLQGRPLVCRFKPPLEAFPFSKQLFCPPSHALQISLLEIQTLPALKLIHIRNSRFAIADKFGIIFERNLAAIIPLPAGSAVGCARSSVG
jgi:hypothetical protein